MDEQTFDALMASADTAMAVVTTVVDDARGGCLIGFHGQCSIDPRRYALWISKANRTHDLAVHADMFAVHLLRRQDVALAALFGASSGDDLDRFERCDWDPGPHGVPLLTAAPNRLIVRRLTMLDAGGDHTGFVTEPLEATTAGPFTPLRLSDVSDLDPGHDPDERRHRT